MSKSNKRKLKTKNQKSQDPRKVGESYLSLAKRKSREQPKKRKPK